MRNLELEVDVVIKPIIRKKIGTKYDWEKRERRGANANLWDMVPVMENPRSRPYKKGSAKKEAEEAKIGELCNRKMSSNFAFQDLDYDKL